MISGTWGQGQLLHQMEKGQVLGVGKDHGSQLHNTYGASKPSLDLASCVASSLLASWPL